MLDNVYVQIIIELLGGFVALIVSVKIIGKRQMSQISPFDFISAIVLGELVGNAIYDKNVSLMQIVFASLLWTLLLYFIEKITQKFIFPRRLIQNAPSFIIKNGKFDYQTMKKERLDFPEVISLLRNKDVFSVQDVDYAIFETSGNLSLVKKLSGSPILTLPIILEGKIIKEHLKYTNHDENWLLNKLKSMNFESTNDILYAEWNINDEIYIQKYYE